MCVRYQHSTAAELNEGGHWGRLAWYGGGGYIQILSNASDNLQHILLQLQTNEYIDTGTRAVFVDFSAYNPYENLFAVARFVKLAGLPCFLCRPIN